MLIMWVIVSVSAKICNSQRMHAVPYLELWDPSLRLVKPSPDNLPSFMLGVLPTCWSTSFSRTVSMRYKPQLNRGLVRRGKCTLHLRHLFTLDHTEQSVCSISFRSMFCSA